MIALLLAGCQDGPPSGAIPTLTVAYPAAGVHQGTIDVVIVATGGPATLDVSVQVDGVAIGTCAAAPCSLRWSTAEWIDGEHLVEATASGHESGWRVVTTENAGRTPDALTLVNPSDGAQSCLGSTLEVRASDEVSLLRARDAGGELSLSSSWPWRWEPGGDTGGHALVEAAFADGSAVQRVFSLGEGGTCLAVPGVSIDTLPWDLATATDVALTAATTGAERLTWSLDGGVLAEPTATPWSTTLPGSTLAEGRHWLTATSFGIDGSRARTQQPIRVDRSPPTISDIAVGDGDNAAGAVDLGATVEDTVTATTTRVSVDGTVLCTSANEEVACSWDTRAAARGVHVVEWAAIDEANNAATATRTLLVDNPPTVAIDAPAPRASIAGVVTITGTSDDDGGASTLEIRAGDQLVSSAFPATLDTCAFARGELDLSATATDDAGQSTTARVTVEVDQPATATLEGLARLVVGEPVSAWSVSDEGALYAELLVDGQQVARSWAPVEDSACPLGCGEACASWTLAPDLSGTVAGPATLELQVIDVFGEVASDVVAVEIVLDADGDGVDAAEAGGTDCDDGDSWVNPLAPETCDGRDEDCDGRIDEDYDADADGHLDVVACTHGDDCDDTDPAVSPSAASDECDGIDNDCDGLSDVAVEPTSLSGSFGAAISPLEVGDTIAGNAFLCTDDAMLESVSAYAASSRGDDLRLVVFEAAAEGEVYWRAHEAETVGATTADWVTWSGLDYRLVPGRAYVLVVESDSTAEVYYDIGAALDESAALQPLGAYDAESKAEADQIDQPPDTSFLVAQRVDVVVWDPEDLDDDEDGVTPHCGDCDDADSAQAPGLAESCDGVDNDCDGGAPGEDDADADNHRGCEGDCNDSDGLAYPGAAERCNGADDDCDGSAPDEADLDGDGYMPCEGDCDDTDPLVGPDVFYADADTDGYGDASNSVLDCTAPTGFVADDSDCDDLEATTNPGASDDCDGIDNDCSGAADEAYTDADGDGWAECVDCDDGDSAVSPTAEEVRANGIDDDCDGNQLLEQWTGSTTTASLTRYADSTARSSAFGSALAGGGDLTGDGTPDFVIASTYSTGTAWIYDDWSASAPMLEITGMSTSIGDMEQISVPGDLDGDGYAEFVVGEQSTSWYTYYQGSIFIFYGPLSTTSRDSLSFADVVLYGEDTQMIASLLAAGGDATGNGTDDLLVGASTAGIVSSSGEGSARGALFVVDNPGTTDGLLIDLASVIWGDDTATNSDSVGSGAAALADFDGDGIDDLAVGGSGSDAGASNGGAAWIMLGPISGTVYVSAADAMITGHANDYIGTELAGRGDHDGDGLGDLVIGDQRHAYSSTTGGVVYLIDGGTPTSGEVDDLASATIFASGSDYFGSQVDLNGDVDVDGHADLLVTDDSWDSPRSNAGAAFLAYGPLAGTIDVTTTGATIACDDSSSSAYMGETALFIGDVDGDGGTDALVGADAWSSSDYGAAWLIGSSP